MLFVCLAQDGELQRMVIRLVMASVGGYLLSLPGNSLATR